MAGGGWRRSAGRVRTLRVLLRDTTRALQDVQDILPCDAEVSETVEKLGVQSSRPTALVILGTSQRAKARLLHCILGRRLLPDNLPRGCRWLRIQYGASTQVHLTLGTSEFELVEDLECNREPWDILPLQDLLRKDNTDLTTVLEVELNNSFLKDGLRIVIPPDIDADPGLLTYQTLKEDYSDFYQKREAILRNYAPIYLYAMDRYGSNIFNETVNKMEVSRNDEDFWTGFSLYSFERVERKAESTESVWKDAESSVFNAENLLDFHQIKEINPNSQFLFILFSDSARESRVELREASECTESCRDRSEELPESDRDLLRDGVIRHTQEPSGQADVRAQEEKIAFMNELLDQWECISNPPPKHHVKSTWVILDDTDILKNMDKSSADTERRRREPAGRTLRSRTGLLSAVLKFATDCAQSALLAQCSLLSEIHVKLVQRLILASFDLARELQVIPKKIQYVARQEQHLYETITEKFTEGDKKQELIQLLQEVLDEMKNDIQNMDWSVDDLPCHQDTQFLISNSTFYSPRGSPVSIPLNRLKTKESSNKSGQSDTKSSERSDIMDSSQQSPDDERDLSDVEEALSYDSFNFDDYDIVPSNDESFAASHSYGMQSVEGNSFGLRCQSSGAWSLSGCSAPLSTKNASLDVQRTVLSKLSHKISLKLVNFVDCLKDAYFGTLERCLQSLEAACAAESGAGGASAAAAAARALAGAARAVDLQPAASYSLLRALLDSLRALLRRLRAPPGAGAAACCALSAAWRRRAALAALASLSAPRLARLLSAQILERLSVAHERYQSALCSLESSLSSRLHHTEDVKLAIRKKYAPSFARLCLESTSMCDLLMYGTPDLGREIGRGQYGVVYAVRGSWAGHSPVAAKSVLPADTRHYHELAMEFFYTRSIPPHPRIVRLLGSLVQRGGAGGAGEGPSVVLVSERWARDLHAAVRAGLSFAQRMRIACDVVDGLRYLHSLGLVHRDVKLKNVVVDGGGRAALADLGFCAAGALVCGSLVGTPLHMAPELLAARYHAPVDVYALGVLLWYLCAGTIKLPAAFESFQNKEQLWSKVKKGLRPERLPQFSDECWDIMQSCWATDPAKRALLGDVQPRLEKVLREAEREGNQNLTYNTEGDEDSLNMTGLDD
ncbi:dual serine/threonine and tyrosine protein kinase-like [Zerene cesonia]|uniref:dual serine/threonine and tyrosine protein kinase-like n=1 Tax=Zerene cesonia TaxID=33412 RepID=UPI0018E52683|nr:dual serine/threonine and tyrosine protein kinase-like [Zerene cesonia]